MKDLIIPEDILQAARMTEDELKREIALMLFQKEKLTLEQASHLAKMNQLQFQHLLASRKITVHYDITDFEKDINTLNKLGRS